MKILTTSVVFQTGFRLNFWMDHNKVLKYNEMNNVGEYYITLFSLSILTFPKVPPDPEQYMIYVHNL